MPEAVEPSADENTYSLIRQPNSGRIAAPRARCPDQPDRLLDLPLARDEAMRRWRRSQREGPPRPMNSSLTSSPSRQVTSDTVATGCPGTWAHIDTWELLVAMGLPPAVTVGLPDSTWPCWVVGTMYGRSRAAPRGRRVEPGDPTTATALPPMVTVARGPAAAAPRTAAGRGGLRCAGGRVGHLVDRALALDLVALTRGCAIARPLVDRHGGALIVIWPVASSFIDPPALISTSCWASMTTLPWSRP